MSHPEHEDRGDERPRYIMIGGFLGAGKTTAIARFGRYLTDRGHRVGLICNDQSRGLVDTTLLRAKGFTVEEIAGGCFCCRFNSLLEASTNLTRAAAPDIFLAEPVGSCTDLVATVSYPLRRIYGDRVTVAPFSVMVDPLRAARILGIESGRSFSRKVVYVYRKQLEEADIIVINKCDAVAASLRDRLVPAIRESFPRAEIFCGSAREGTGLEPWFESVLAATGDAVKSSFDLELDYDIYAEGEALLGWLNCTVRLESGRHFDANRTLVGLARAIGDRIAARDLGSIAHLKMTLDADDGTGTLSVVSLVESDGEPDLRESLLDTTDRGVLVINLRAEADPERLAEATREALASLESTEGIRVTVEHLEQLRPGRPVPTHRVLSGDLE